jgi:ribonuclease HII
MIGIDEVGRGCWAGPLLVVAARQISDLPKGIDDSKKLSKKKRSTLFYDIELACDTGEGWVSAEEVDALGLTKAMYVAVERALEALNAQPDEDIIMDGNINYCPPTFLNGKAVIDADALHPIVGAASIYAKVLRDSHMAAQDKLYPGYSFEKHVGYGTAAHSAALKELGLCALHRKSFKPIRAYS